MSEQIFLALVSAVIYALSGLFKSLPKGEKVDIMKFGATIMFGLFIGAIILFLNIPVTEANLTLHLATYAGLLVVFENILKGLKEYLILKGYLTVTS